MAEVLSSQKAVILIIGISVIFILSLLIYIRSERSKKRELILETQQKEANEDIYKLMLEQLESIVGQPNIRLIY